MKEDMYNIYLKIQIKQILKYKAYLLRKYNKNYTDNDAAILWISKYAALFGENWQKKYGCIWKQ